MAYTTIKKPSDYFNTITYTGNAQANTNRSAGFQPGLIWIKQRNGTGNHRLVDSVRGANKILYSTGTNANDTSPMISAITSTGYTTSDTSSGVVNGNGESYVNWFLKANGAGSANTTGSINSTVSANTTSGFSIVKWSGSGANATIGHGLGVAPKMVITKSLGTGAWGVYNENLGNTNVMFLNTGAATSANIAYWNNTSPTSSVFSVGTDSAVNHSGNDMIAYCFAEKTGYSKFGSYVGNGNANGTFVYTGFKPAFVLWKNTTDGYGWYMLDNKRDPDNVAEKYIYANSSDAEGTNPFFDLLSNGFKIRESGGGSNGSGATYIYMAFAEQPLIGDNPATAR